MISLAVSYLLSSNSTPAANNLAITRRQSSQEPKMGWMAQLFLKYSPRDAQYVEAVKKCIHVHTILSNHVVEGWSIYCCALLNYHAVNDPSFAYDEQRLCKIFERAEAQIERTFEDIVVCVKGLWAGYLVQAGASREKALKIGQPIAFEEAIETDDPIEYIVKLNGKVPERVVHYTLMTKKITCIFNKIIELDSVQFPDEYNIQLFVNKKIEEIYNRVDHLENISFGRFLLGGGFVTMKMSKGEEHQIKLD
ncbi:Conserved hypothetical protein [Candidatus Protochlamydia naegleriophila]|uniref:Uncharacterized protein n=1 Tax=Candidatus Protochlamydia naegleriophila TaxID=389348 RepID=A0A0U5J9B4_9BACT|nr:hypothetical protein [Candidatus Protochlamydia naegleriophila]CUI15703.1 Conserved hypothetical protein [Candidatus Protochlamydia naegleriophila]